MPLPARADLPDDRLAASSGDGTAAERVRAAVEQNYAVVWRFLRRLGVPAEAADDAAHLTFARVLARDSVVREGSERAYLMRAAFHVSLEFRRAHRRASARDAGVEGDALAAPDPGPEEALAQRRDRELLDSALSELSPDLRAVLTLFELEGLTFTEIAEVLELPRGTVASRLRRARESFARAVQRLRRGDRP
jgi:RNA polymerase sigma-70 factor (ECF subfamily)